MASIRNPVASVAAALLAAACSAGAGPSSASLTSRSASSGGSGHGRGQGHYVQRNLVSDGFVPAEHTDPNLVNAWGMARLATSPWWIADNGAGVTTLYDGEGVAQFGTPPLVVGITGAGGGPGAPDGAVANPTSSFVVSAGGGSGPARFLFASEDGTISGWNPGVPPPTPPATRSTETIVAVDQSSADPLGGSVYKGLAIASTPDGDRLYATDFRQGRVDVFDGAFAPVAKAGAFVDPGIPDGFAPFGIQVVGDTVYVTYAMQDATRHDDVAGKHLGFVSAFTTDGTWVRRVASGGKLDSPWGVALAPASGFGRFSGKLLVGNFGDGHVIVYRLDRGDDDGDGDGDGEADDRGEGDDDGAGGQYLTGPGGRITIEGLWGIGFGNDSAAGPANALFFAAGPGDESHGLFGRIDFVPDPE
ncbi:MAG TPA: TIGR03118 family protein [Anaeromyxobacteraceae bacterium]|nr:TIGR03118 family protein [Anaeromyxobacteraceae bacterium]